MPMKIITLCGCGLGTCFVLKFTAEKAAKELNLQALITPSDIGSSGLEQADLYLVPYGLNSALCVRGSGKVVSIRNVVSVAEVKAAIQNVLRDG